MNQHVELIMALHPCNLTYISVPGSCFGQRCPRLDLAVSAKRVIVWSRQSAPIGNVGGEDLQGKQKNILYNLHLQGLLYHHTASFIFDGLHWYFYVGCRMQVW